MAQGALVPEFSLEQVFEGFKRRFFGVAEKAFTSLGAFQNELGQHLGKITELNGEIAKKNAEFAMEMWEFEKDICSIRDYYDKIISSTKSVVDYGTHQQVIPNIQDLIRKKQYLEAEKEIRDFLQRLRTRIQRVEDDISSLKQNCPDLEKVKQKIREKNAFVDGGTKDKENEVSESQYGLFKLGSYTIFYTMAGAVTSMVFFSKAPIEGSEITTALMAAGTEALTFYTGSVARGLSSVMDASKLSIALQNKITQSVAAVRMCLAGFFNEVNNFQKHIHTIQETCFQQLDADINHLEDDIDRGSDTLSAWMSRSEILQKMFEGFTHLSTHVIEVQSRLDDNSFKDVMKQLERGIDVVSLGTPV